jgi:Ca-activated chloride channel family protein
VRFGQVAWLWWLLVVPAVGALLAWAAFARKRALARFGDPVLVARLRDGAPTGWRAGRNAMLLVALALLAIASARPQHGSRTEVVSRRGIDVVVCLDVSKSMLARDVAPSRIERAKAELERLLQEEPGDRVGVVIFAGDTMEYPLTTDHEAATRFFRDAHPWEFPVQGTSIGRALTAARETCSARPPRGATLQGDPRSSPTARTSTATPWPPRARPRATACRCTSTPSAARPRAHPCVLARRAHGRVRARLSRAR